MSKSAPKAPDYEAAAQQQAQSSKEVTNMQTFANRPDQVTPWGSTTWSNAAVIDPATGQPVTAWQQNTSLTPELQAALDSQIQAQLQRSQLAESMLPRLGQEYGQAMDWSGFTDLSKGPQANQYTPEDIQRSLSSEGLPGIDPSQRYLQSAEDALYGKFRDRADPRYASEEEALRTRLYNQGLREGDAAFNNEMLTFQQNKGDAYTQAAYDAALKGGEEASRMFGMDTQARGQLFGERSTQGAFANQAANQALQQQLALGGQQYNEQMQSSNYQNQLRQQQIAEAMQQRGFTLNEIQAILNGQQVNMPSMPSFSNAQRAEGVQALQAAQLTGQAELDRFNAQQQATQGMISGIGSLAGGAMAFSDRRLKKNIRKLWVGAKGLMLYTFNYIWEADTAPTHSGYMADEVEAKFPHAVVDIGGFKAVIYGSF